VLSVLFARRDLRFTRYRTDASAAARRRLVGYVERRPDPTDRRAKLITLTESGRQCVAAGIDTIGDIERRITDVLGVRGHRELRKMLLTLLEHS
jgi:DNA-binding MarR family transcriptional regulator